MKHHFTVNYIQDGPWILAIVEEIPGAFSQGKTIEEARENITEALRMIIDYNREQALEEVQDRKSLSRELVALEYA